MEYGDVLYWDRIDGVDGDVSKLSVIDEVEIEGDAYSFDDDEDEAAEEEKTGSGLFKEPSEIFNIIFKNIRFIAGIASVGIIFPCDAIMIKNDKSYSPLYIFYNLFKIYYHNNQPPILSSHI